MIEIILYCVLYLVGGEVTCRCYDAPTQKTPVAAVRPAPEIPSPVKIEQPQTDTGTRAPVLMRQAAE